MVILFSVVECDELLTLLHNTLLLNFCHNNALYYVITLLCLVL